MVLGTGRKRNEQDFVLSELKDYTVIWLRVVGDMHRMHKKGRVASTQKMAFSILDFPS